jgi:cytochrome c553
MPALSATPDTDGERAYQEETESGYRYYCTSCHARNGEPESWHKPSHRKMAIEEGRKLVKIVKGKKTCESCLAKRRKGKKTKDQIIAEKDARIAELEAEVARLSQLVENSNA